MASEGTHKSPSGLELVVVSPRIDIINSSGSRADGGNGSNNGKGRELALVERTNDPASSGRGEEDAPIFSMEMEGEDAKGSSSSSKPRKYMRLSPRQFGWLEAAFEESHCPDIRTMDFLAERLKVSPRQVQLWFANRRSRSFKQLLKRTEMQRDHYKQQVSSLNKEVSSLTKEKHCLESELEKLKAAAPMEPSPPPATPVLLPVPGPIQAFVELCHDCGCTFRTMVTAPPPPAAPMLPPVQGAAQESFGLCQDCRRTFRTMAAAAASLPQPKGGARATAFIATTSAPPPSSSASGFI